VGNYADRTNRPPRTLSDAEQAKLLKVSGAKREDFRDHMILSLALGTGLREGEISALKIGDVMRPDGKPKRAIQLRYYARKGKRRGKKATPTDDAAQIVHLPDACYYKLEKFLRTKDHHGIAPRELVPSSPLFWSRQGDKGISTRRMREIFADWQQRAGFDNPYCFHELRHTAITNAYRHTRDVRIAQRVARHARIDTTTRYEHASDQEVATATRGMPA
jgi:site-specific recombinase XerD